jgi:nicotinate-nucleotide pyrophosphorylase (carboxylating)
MDLKFARSEEEAAERLIRMALAEDLPEGDVTSESLIPPGVSVRAAFVPRQAGVLCGIPVVLKLFTILDPRVRCRPLATDGEEARAGSAFLEVVGPARAILAGERSALNFLGRLSGIATRTRSWLSALKGAGVVLLDTRKTIPGWRLLEKYAVRAGGGANHRFSLSDQALVKDNHRAILKAAGSGGPREWVAAIRKLHPGLPVELEVESLEELREALDSGADILLLDNMPVSVMAQAAREVRARGKTRPLLEASGGIDAARLGEVAASGVDRISSGALTHSAAVLDIGLDFLEVLGEAKRAG